MTESINIYVGNLSYETDSYDIGPLFENYGDVVVARVIYDHDTGRSRGFGFVEMATREDGERAIQALHDQEFMGRKLNVNEAMPRGQKRREFSNV